MRCDSKQFFKAGHHLLDQHFEVGPHQPQLQLLNKIVAFFFPSHYDTLTLDSEKPALSYIGFCTCIAGDHGTSSSSMVQSNLQRFYAGNSF